ncbi:hypothetical protein B0T11DRAFT_271871 [Plectosphaerella cucumerina]|uniref:Uncharacterized protein n=1 Tax=Plectosphaerella cucumerina TaxID=40658 RepID=A0A8K0X8V4_9PEZI|nr:hypothetical protein B0T11DRAFT_271871 [Plectosphaerella cucumerina]
MPCDQFEDQCQELIKGTEGPSASRGSRSHQTAMKLVKHRLILQGIWRNEWNAKAIGAFDTPGARWKHEDPEESEADLRHDTDADATAAAAEAGPSSGKREIEPRRRPVSAEERLRIAERRRVREASRPLPQFIAQISLETKRIFDKGNVRDTYPNSINTDAPDIADVNSRAYKHVKAKWVKRGIWNDNWGVLPGMSWKHERFVEKVEVSANGRGK